MFFRRTGIMKESCERGIIKNSLSDWGNKEILCRTGEIKTSFEREMIQNPLSDGNDNEIPRERNRFEGILLYEEIPSYRICRYYSKGFPFCNKGFLI